ncbi:MAG: hypothetical protein Q3M30_17380 [Candidatus Electrothrix sp. Rat3]|nr:hypothetical protein [Candidatus Electrothrix rattekaaiensis]
MNKNISVTQQDLPPAALDFHTLRREGIRLIESLGSKFWTDYNTHDPGITILEQLCYALTDLLYRIDYPVSELLAEGGGDPYASLFSPAKILPSSPVTLLDLRKFILDIDGVRNAWVEPFAPEFNDTEPELYFNRKKKTLTLSNDGQAESLIIKGLYQVWVEPEAGQNEAKLDELENDVHEYLHGYRSLCDDFTVTILKEPKNNGSGKNHIEKIGITASIEIDPAADSTEVGKALFQKIEDYFSPPVRFYSLKERLEAIKYIDEIFEGPLLTKGFIDNKELKKNIRRTELRTSDLIRLFMDVKGVLAVQDIAFKFTGYEVTYKDDKKEIKEIPKTEKWLLKLEKGIIPRVDKDKEKTAIKLIQGDQEISLAVIKEDTADLSRPPGIDELPRPVSQDRHITGNYFSIQHQFPDCYGINSRGLPGSASSLRQAKAKQLKAYLILFDQLLANEFAQLANAGRLFSFADEDADVPSSTYCFNLLDDHELGLDMEDEKNCIWTKPEKQQRLSLLERLVRNADEKELERKNRFLEHLSARFAEQLANYSPQTEKNKDFKDQQKEIERKQNWLRNYPELSRNRAVSYCKPADADHRTGLERRIRLKFDIDDSEPFYIIEHILLRPIKQDEENSNAPAILANTKHDDNDPYSLQVTVVHRAEYCSLRPSIREEFPAHLNVNFYPSWEEDEIQSEEKLQIICHSYQKWREAMMHDSSPNHQKLRAARDRIIDLLGIGKTYPLIDLDIKDESVLYGKKANVLIIFGQSAVSYQLFWKKENNEDQLVDSTSKRSGEDVVLTITEPIKTNETKLIYKVKAKKNDHDAIELSKKAIVRVGINAKINGVGVIKEIRSGEEHNIDIDEPPLIHFGSKVQVQLDGVQEGVRYRLVLVSDSQVKKVLSGYIATKEGKNSIILESKNITEDTELSIEASKIDSGGAGNAEILENLPILVRVRANPDIKIIKNNDPYEYDIVEPGKTVNIPLRNSQKGVRYQSFQRQLIDADFIFGDGERTGLMIPVDGFDAVHVNMPKPLSEWEKIPKGFSVTGDEQDGTDGQLTLSPPLNEDSLIIIRAEKKHKEDSSAVQLKQAVVLLATPHPNQALSLQLHIKNGKAHSLQVADGETGVFYHFRLEENGDEICLPAYFHQWADGERANNKGIGEEETEGLRIEKDFVVTSIENLQTPILSFSPPLSLNDDTTLHIQARKARTNVSTKLEYPVKLPSVPAIEEPGPVMADGKATIRVTNSKNEVRYQLWQDGETLLQEKEGNNGLLEFVTPSVIEETNFTIRSIHNAEGNMTIKFDQEVLIKVSN